jgi:tetrahydromethanopterin S-methyltransferase subunit G
MSSLKIVLVVLLAIILFLSLAVFGVAFSMKMTALNAGFINSHLERLDISILLDELDTSDIYEENPEVVGYVREVIQDNELEIKQRLGQAIDDIYDYLLRRSESLDLAEVLGDSILDPDFAIYLVEQSDVTLLAEELAVTMTPEDLNLPFSLEPYLDDVAVALEPWLKQQAGAVIPEFYDYILGEGPGSGVVISLESAKGIFRDSFEEAFLESPPPQMAGMSHDELEQAFTGYYAQFEDEIPVAIKLDLDGLETPDQVAESLAEVEDALAESRRYIGHFNIVYGVVIGLMLLMVAGIILIYREVRGSSRVLGIIFAAYGVIGLISFFVARAISRSPIINLDVPASFQAWLLQLSESYLIPMLILTTVLLVVGAALLTVSFIYHSRQPKE